MSHPPDYCQPSPFLAHKAVRAMTRCGAAADIGAAGFALVAIIGHQQDAVGYTRPVSFWVNTLVDALGFTSRDAFYKTEAKCRSAGWLKKHNQGTRRPVLYWIAIPNHAEHLGSGPSDDVDETSTNQRTNQRTNETDSKAVQSQTDARTNQRTPSSLSLSLVPIPRETPAVQIEGDQEQREPDPADVMEVRPPSPMTEDQEIHIASAYMGWNVLDERRRADNRETLLYLVREHPERYKIVAKRLRAENGQKPLPYQVEQAIADEARSEPEQVRKTPKRQPFDDAVAIIRRDGVQACMERLGYRGEMSFESLVDILDDGNDGAIKTLLDQSPPLTDPEALRRA